MCVRASLLAAATLMAGLAGAAHAQPFPTKPVRIIVPFAAGGTGDTTSRFLGEQITKELGQPVIVENRPSAGAVIGYELGARAPADGHTMAMVFPSFVVNPSIRRVQYDPIKDFRAVTQTISLPMAFVVHPSLPVKTMKELIALARAKPGEISYSTPGVATIQHVLSELFRLSAKVDVTHVPYSGGAPAMTALVGGHVMSNIGNVFQVAPFVKTGKIRALAVTTGVRAESLPDVPTMREAGYPDLEATNWAGYVVPAATPTAAVVRLNTELVRALRRPDIQEKFKAQGTLPAPSTPEEFAALLRSESARYTKVVHEAKIKAE